MCINTIQTQVLVNINNQNTHFYNFIMLEMSYKAHNFNNTPLCM